MQLRRWSSRQVTISRTRGSAGTPASVARLQQLQVQQIFVEKEQEQRQPELQGPQPGPGDPICRSLPKAKLPSAKPPGLLGSTMETAALPASHRLNPNP
ncbi:hypothetical protein DV515_00008145 [Chloebia gouldiae]|uniref:Uncharacterized protein n=1 Tax=Chloebia gouldiae TaxID=44316 RepID=A0A3L8SFK6_CHLGU|nr:hypothetical protein DV515_00008145 [Chloebia gouldiae]